MKNLGYGKDYQCAHDYQEKITNMQCLPDNLAGRSWYKPTEQGFERRLRTRLDEIRNIKSKGASSK
jgi:putative ATPase